VALGRTGRAGQLVKIARLLAVVQDDLLIKIAQFVKHFQSSNIQHPTSREAPQTKLQAWPMAPFLGLEFWSFSEV